LASGQLRDSVVTVDGDEIVHSLYGPGMVVGEPGFFAPERNRVVAVVALEPCTLLELGREHLVPRLLRHPPAMIRLLEGLATVARGQTEIIAALARRPSPSASCSSCSTWPTPTRTTAPASPLESHRRRWPRWSARAARM